MLEKIIIVRHGDYDGEGYSDTPLSAYGIRQIQSLHEQLQPQYSGRVAIITSPTIRTYQTALLLASPLGIVPEQVQVLVSGSFEDPHPELALSEINQRGAHAETVIVVTHAEYSEELPPYIGRTMFNLQVSTNVLRRGEAWLIDCQQQTFKRIKHRAAP